VDAKADGFKVKEKKYTEDHEWVEVSEDGKTGIST
jgi:glycine cleavage system H lipoate-binding protein